MKVLRDRSMGKQGLLRTRKKNRPHYIWMCLLPMLFIACSGSLGKIQLENVNTVIVQSETAIEQAHLANAQYLASDTLQQAENALVSAEEALSAKDGLGAMHLAYNALTQAQIAEQEAMYKSQGNGLNAIIKRKEAGIVALEANLRTADEVLENLERMSSNWICKRVSCKLTWTKNFKRLNKHIERYCKIIIKLESSAGTFSQN